MRKLDYRLFWLINGRFHNRFIDFPVRIVNRIDTALGNLGKLVLLLLLIAAATRFFKGQGFVTYFAVIVAVLAVNTMAGYGVKRLVKVRRPLYVFGDRIHVFSEKLHKYSMPSGHAQVAFCLATLLGYWFPGYAWLFYVWAASVGLYRVYVGSHFPSDVVVGAIMGFGITRIMLGLLAPPL